MSGQHPSHPVHGPAYLRRQAGRNLQLGKKERRAVCQMQLCSLEAAKWD